MKLYSMIDAAKYTGYSIHTLKKHYHRTKKLKGQTVGGVVVFTQAQLDAFKRTKRPQGRPPNDKKTS